VRADSVTASIRARADEFHEVYALDDAQLADLIRRHRVDVLVDLAGHTQGSRLLAFARKPAPVQFSYCGYPNTTGLPAIDYRITDALADPPGGEAERLHVERLARVDGGFLAYPLDAARLPPVAPPPALANGHVTFGSFNNLSKISATTLRLWREVLAAVPASRLIIKAGALGDARTRELARRRFEDTGLPMARVELLGHVVSPLEHLAMYRRIDVALDAFPYNGTTTTCEALSMGVPVVSLHGTHHVSRVGLSLLTAAGFPQWATDDEGKFVEIARSLALDVAALATLRAQMRTRLSASALCDGRRLARGVEAAFRDAWRSFCASLQSRPSQVS
jgi:predicted O-linked N-acetylglucosamine transferase (SPINDLY family)